MPTLNQYETIKQQVLSFTPLGCLVKFEMEHDYHPAPRVLIIHENKSYRFCDPDWDIVSRQLNKLYFTIKGKQ